MLVLVPREVVGTVHVSPVPCSREGGGVEVRPLVLNDWDVSDSVLFDSSA